jgi:type I restriction enzyme, S subunit
LGGKSLKNLPKLPDNWFYIPLGELGELTRGKSKHRPRNDPKLFGNVVPFLQTGEVARSQGKICSFSKMYSEFGVHQSRIFPKGTICITIAANIADTGILDFDACFPDSIVGLITKDSLADKFFVEFYLRTIRADLAQLASATAQANINLGILQKVIIPLPPLNEQRRIVAKIEALKARSQRVKEALSAIPTLLDQFRQSVLAAAFRGDLTADWREENPDVEPASLLIKRIESQIILGKETGRAATINIIPGRAALSVGDTQAPVPKNWFRVSLLKIARLESGHTPSRKHPEYWDGDIPWIGIADARENHGKYILNTLQHTNEKGLANSAARLLPKNTVCLSRTASVGYTVIMAQPMATSQDFVNWICSDALLPKFLLYAFLAEGEHLLKFGKGTTHTTIYFPEVKAFHLILPPIEEQKKIVQSIELFFKSLTDIEQQYQTAQGRLGYLEQSILAKAFRGELAPQDPNDEPASLLLERIHVEREKLQSKIAKKSTPKTDRGRSKKSKLQESEPVQMELELE